LHGDGSAPGDLAEAMPWQTLAAETGSWPALYATKGAHGNLVSAAGPLEAAGILLALEQETVPPSRNCQHADPACGLPLVADGPRTVPGMRTGVVSALGAFGEAACLVLTRGV
jgi:3-oxoacyl-[acyl-carrier-protein] synthase II